MHKKQQDRKKRKNFTPELFERYFRRNEGTTDYATIPEVTLAGAFSLSVDVLTTATGVESICGNSGSFANYVALNVSGNDLQVRVNNTPINFTAPNINNGTLSTLTINRDAGDNITASLAGAGLAGGGVASGSFVVDFLCANDAPSNHLSGILANLKIWDNGTLIRDYKLNDNSDTLVDSASGQNGTVVNGNASDWGLFQQQVTREWLGQELVVNGGFDSDSDWTLGAGSSIQGGELVFGSGTTFADQSSIKPNVLLRFEFSVTQYGSGLVGISGTTLTPSFLTTAMGDYVVEQVPNATTTLRLVSTDAGNAIDNVSVKEVLNVS